MKRFGIAILGCVLVSLLGVGCNTQALGEQCRTEASTSECTDGTICAPDSVNRLVCQAVCTKYSDCPSGFDCVAVPGASQLACRPK